MKNSEGEIIRLVTETQHNDPDFLYEDPDFPATNASLFSNLNKLPEYALPPRSPVASDQIIWQRPSEFSDDPDYFKSTSGCGMLREGTLNDAWLLGVFAALAVHPDNLIENLFVSELHDFKKYGVYTCRFYKDAQWMEVTTDTRLPCTPPASSTSNTSTTNSTSGGSTRSLLSSRGSSASLGSNLSLTAGTNGSLVTTNLLYGGNATRSELFVAFLEKAYAKLHGSYQSLDNGKILEAFLDCTGGSGQKIDLTDDKLRHETTQLVLWKKLMRNLTRQRNLVTVQLKQATLASTFPSALSSSSSSSSSSSTTTANSNANEVTGHGILRNHQYLVLYVKEIGDTLRFIKLKNVWSRGNWKGDWCNDDNKWEEHLQIENALRSDPKCDFNRSGSDGCFWMVYEDFLEVFNEVYLVYLFPEDQQYLQYCVRGEWSGTFAGGAPTKTLNDRGAVVGSTSAAAMNGLTPRLGEDNNATNGGGGSSGGGGGTGTAGGGASGTSGVPGVSSTSTLPGTARDTGAAANAVPGTSGGNGDLQTGKTIDRTRWVVLNDSENSWFKNQQFKVVAQEKTQVHISLIQRDFRLYGGDNYAINFVVLKTKSHSIAWEYNRSNVVAEAHSYEFVTGTGASGNAAGTNDVGTGTGGAGAGAAGGGGGTSLQQQQQQQQQQPKQLPERELIKEDITLDPDVTYLIVPYTTSAKVDMEFFLRVFSTKPLHLEALPRLHSCLANGKWRIDEEDNNEISNAGGPLLKNLTGGSENASWGRNPQFWVRLKNHQHQQSHGHNGSSATHFPKTHVNLKVVLKKTSYKATNAKNKNKELLSKEKHNLIGLSVVRAVNRLDESCKVISSFAGNTGTGTNGSSARSHEAAAVAAARRRSSQQRQVKTNFLGKAVEKSASITLSSSNGNAATTVVNLQETKQNPHVKSAEEADEKDDPDLVIPSPRLVVNPEEWCRLSDYSSAAIACLSLRKLPVEWLERDDFHENDGGGLLIVPSLGEPNAEGVFELEVVSDLPLSMTALNQFTTQSVSDEWNDGKSTAGGCHLQPDWKKNPRFLLYLKGVRPAKVTITLTRSELEWKSKCKKDAVGSMMGFYLFHGNVPTNLKSALGPPGSSSNNSGSACIVMVNGKPWTQTDFVPVHCVSSPIDMVLPSTFNEPYVIMPTTYEPNQNGRFVLSVRCDLEFTLSSSG